MSARRAVEMTRLFYYWERLVRAMVIKGKVWFRANDVATALGYSKSNHAAAKAVIDHVPRRWRVALGALLGRSETLLFDRLGHNKSLETWIPELGVYALAFGAEKPDTDAFAEWVHNEVVPACH
jgi:prophage antirepressor-like protein